jgi:S1-C subfamily serine protease
MDDWGNWRLNSNMNRMIWTFVLLANVAIAQQLPLRASTNVDINGQGVETNYTEAANWYRKAAEQGNSRAQSMLGYFYSQGIGVPRDYNQAVIFCQRAAKQGNAFGEALLGECYGEGTGVPINDIEAYKWISLSLAHELRTDISDSTLADSFRNIVTSWFNTLQVRMSREEIVEAQRLAAAFVPQKESQDAKPNTEDVTTTFSPTATGTGFFITGDGYLISNYHVVKDATKVRLVTNAGLIDAKVVQVDAANDLALLKADGKFSSLPIATSRTVNLGGTVATIGFPDIGLQGFAPKLAKGEIASLSGAGDDPRYFQISVPVQPGNSGGALLDERGNVIGIVSAKLDAGAALAASGALPENVNYAVKSSLLLSFLESAPDVDAKLKAPNTVDEKFEDVVKSAQDAAVLVLVY